MNRLNWAVRRARAGVCATFLMIAAPAAAAPLQAPLVGGSISFNLSPPPGVNFNTFGNFDLTGPGGAVGFTAAGMPGPLLTARAMVTPNFTARSTGTLIYEIEVVGPSGDVAILVDVAGGVTGSSTTIDPFAGFVLKSLWSLADVNLGLQVIFSEGIDTGVLTGAFSQGFNHTVGLQLTANRVYRVTMVADVFAGAGTTGASAAGTAFIDPIFRLGAGVGDGYSIVVSDGIGNGAVPEPATFAITGLGLLGAAYLGRRKRARG